MSHSTGSLMPREHGATAMLLAPFVCAAVLLRRLYWQEAVALVAIAVAFRLKDPLVVLARQRLVWKQPHAEAATAKRSAALEVLLLVVCSLLLLLTRDWRRLGLLALGAVAFSALTVAVNVKNRQRSTPFQVATAVALSSTSIAACLSAINRVPEWCWLLWGLCSLQAAAGIFVVHARLDARIGAKHAEAGASGNRTAAIVMQVVLILAAGAFAFDRRYWIAGGLLIAALFYSVELVRQRNAESLQMPLKRVGQQALAMSIAFSTAMIVGLW